MEAKAGMNRLNRRRFMALSSAGVASAVLVACGNESASEADLNPTMIPDVAGAPPTLAPMSTPPQTGGGAGGQGAGGDEGQAAEGGQAAGGGATTVDVEAGDLYFEPNEFEISPGGTINLTNAGALQHDMYADDWIADELVPILNGGESGQFTVPEDAEVGTTVTFYCSVPGHRDAGMEGTFTVVEAGGGGGEAGATAEGATPEGATPAATAEAPAGGEAAGGASEVAVSAFEMGFEPTEFEVSPGAVITMTNDGLLEHDFSIDEFGGVLIGPFGGGESGEWTVPDDAEPGEYEFYCSVPGHRDAGMVGTMTVV